MLRLALTVVAAQRYSISVNAVMLAGTEYIDVVCILKQPKLNPAHNEFLCNRHIYLCLMVSCQPVKTTFIEKSPKFKACSLV